MLVKYIRDRATNRKRGVLVGFRTEDDRFVVGYSLCHKTDQYNPNVGIELAKNRAVWWKDTRRSRVPPLPSNVEDEMPRFYDRCRRFFKGCSGPQYLDHMGA